MTDIIHTPVNYFSNGANSINNEDRKLFVGNLSFDTTEQDLMSYFGQFGTIAKVTIKYNAQTGHPRGFAFVTFTSDGSVDAVLENGPHSLKNKQIDPRKAKSRPTCKKIFVGGLNSQITEDEIRKYFGQFGSVEGVELPYDHTRNRRREFCFVIFDNEEAADKACYEPKQNIGGRDVDIKKAQPQNIQKQTQRRTNGVYQNQSGYNSNGYSNGMGNYNNDYGNNWRSDRSGGYRNQNNSGGYQNNGGYQTNYQRRPRHGGFSHQMNPADTNSYTNYNRQPDYVNLG